MALEGMACLMACLMCLRFQAVFTRWKRKMLYICSQREREREFSIQLL